MGDQEVWVQQMSVTGQMVLPPGTMVLSGVVLAECPGGLRTTYSGEPYWLAWCQPEGLPEGHYLIPREEAHGPTVLTEAPRATLPPDPTLPKRP